MSIAISCWLISAEYNNDDSEDMRILNSLFVILLNIPKVVGDSEIAYDLVY
jgi:hypothetical protein